MPNDERKKSSRGNDGGDVIWMYLAVLALALVVLVPVGLSLIAWMVFARYLGRRESLALVAAGTLGWVLSFDAYATSYGRWLADIVTGDVTLSATPVVMLAATTCLFTGIYGLLLSTSVSARVPKHLRGIGKPRPGKSDLDPIVPTAEVKSRLQPAKPDGSSLLVSKSAHAISGGQEPGKRTFPLGIGINGTPIMLSEAEVRTHGVILGATGSGKSETIKALAGALLDLGWSGMLLDLKEDTAPGGLRDWCADYAQTHSLPYQELRLSDPHSKFWFNALAGMGPDEVRDMILTLNEFDDQYWQAINKEMLGQAVNLMMWAHQANPQMFPEPTMYDLGKLLSGGNIPRATKKLRAVVLDQVPGVTEEDFRVLESPGPDHAKSALGFGSKLTLIYDTQAGRTVLRPGTAGEKRMVDVTARGLTYIGLDSQGKADLTRVISSSILQRMSVYAAARVTGQVTGSDARAPRFLIVDEANWVDRTIVQNLLSRARSAGIAMFLCTQGPEDWIDAKGDDWGKLTQNTNVAIVMRQGAPRAAEICADYIGTHVVTKTQRSQRVQEGMFGQERVMRDDRGRLVSQESERESEEYLVPPETVRQMGVGEAVLKVGVPSRVEWMRVQMRDPKARAH